MNKFTITEKYNIWISSDLHFSHRNICKGTTTWKNGFRDFDTIEDMNNTIINNINKYVLKDDIFFILGDLTFGNPYNLILLRRNINCENVYVILGNHDKGLRDNKPIKTESSLIYPQTLFKEVTQYKKIYVDKQTIIMNHYAYRVWDGSHHGSWNLYGHSHDSLPPIGKQMDIGIDTAYRIFGEYRPFSFQEIKNIMDSIEVKMIDHHNNETN